MQVAPEPSTVEMLRDLVISRLSTNQYFAIWRQSIYRTSIHPLSSFIPHRVFGNGICIVGIRIFGISIGVIGTHCWDI